MMATRYAIVGGFIVGIFFGPFSIERSPSFMRIDWFVFFLVVLCGIAALCAIIIFRNLPSIKKIGRIVLIISLFILVGIGRYMISEINLFPRAQTFYVNKNNFIGAIVSEPEVRNDKIRFIVDARIAENYSPKEKIKGMYPRASSGLKVPQQATGNLTKTRPPKPAGEGGSKMIVYQPLTGRYRYGDEISFSCAPKFPQRADEKFDLYEYLARYGARATCWPNNITIVSRDNGNWMYKKLLSSKSKVIYILKREIREPYSAFLRAMILNDRSDMPKYIDESFKKTGTSHVIAISGLHFVILFGIIETILYYFFRRRYVFWILTLFLIAYSAMVGFPGSVVRASAMVWVLRAAHELRRAQKEEWILWLTVAVLLLINPHLARGDIGFMLSVSALAGIIYFKPLCDTLFSKIKYGTKIFDPMSTTISAMLFTAPLIAYYFDSISLIGIIANLIIVFLSSVILGAGVLIIALGALLGNLIIVNWLVEMLVAILFAITSFFASLPFAQITSIHLTVYGLLVSYALLTIIIVYGNKKCKM